MKKFIVNTTIIMSMCCMLCAISRESYAYEKNSKSHNKLNSEVSVTKVLKEERNAGFVILKSAGISLLISTVMCIIIISKHKPVKVAKTANNYLNEDKAYITKRDDILISSTVDKQLR